MPLMHCSGVQERCSDLQEGHVGEHLDVLELDVEGCYWLKVSHAMDWMYAISRACFWCVQHLRRADAVMKG